MSEVTPRLRALALCGLWVLAGCTDDEASRGTERDDAGEPPGKDAAQDHDGAARGDASRDAGAVIDPGFTLDGSTHTNDASHAPTDAGARDAGPDAGPRPLGLKIKQLASGGSFVCALTEAGGVKCWGEGSYGSLGNGVPGTTVKSPSAVDVVGLESGVRSISASYFHACAIKEDGALRCWGYNEYQQLAIDPKELGSPVPVAVNGADAPGIAVSVAKNHGCYVTQGGAVRCWGLNSFFTLGVTGIESSSTAVDAALNAGVVNLSTGMRHTCALSASGTVSCWGMEWTLGRDGEKQSSATPVTVVGLENNVQKITGGDNFNCALTKQGAVKCWGTAGTGRLGNGEYNTTTHAPVDSIGLSSGVKDIASGQVHTCAVLDTGGVRCWGLNMNGGLGNQTTSQAESVPVDVIGLSGATLVAGGRVHSCAALAQGGVKCWGGAPGTGTTSYRDELVPIDINGI